MQISIVNQQQLGSAIRQRRKALNLRIDDAALLCGIAVSTLSAIENGSRPSGMDKILPVLHGLGIGLALSISDSK